MTPKDTRILIVDDEVGITDLLSMALQYEGYRVEVAQTGHRALQAITLFRPALVILDVMLPDLNGFEVMAKLPDGDRRIPVIFLTARGELEDKLRGFTLGGDDYVTKPFSIEELLFRINAMLRRTNAMNLDDHILRFADIALDEEQYEVVRGKKSIILTPTEFKLLHYLLLNTDRVVSKAQILDRVWQYDFGGNGNVVETFISSLRRKLEEYGPRVIFTVRGIGYKMRTPSDQS